MSSIELDCQTKRRKKRCWRVGASNKRDWTEREGRKERVSMEHQTQSASILFVFFFNTVPKNRWIDGCGWTMRNQKLDSFPVYPFD